MISKRRVVYKCVALVGIVCIVFYMTSSRRGFSRNNCIHRLMGREHENTQVDLQEMHSILRSRAKSNGQYTTRSSETKDTFRDFGDIEDIGKTQNGWINSAQLNMGLKNNLELHPVSIQKEHANSDHKPIFPDELRHQLPVEIVGNDIKEDLKHLPIIKPERFDVLDEGYVRAHRHKGPSTNKTIGRIRDGDRKEAMAADKPEPLPDKPPVVTNYTAPVKPLRKRVRVIRKTMRNGKVVHQEVVGIKTVTTTNNNTTSNLVKSGKKVLSYDEIWYHDILNGNFKANPVKLNNKTRESPYLTEKLWRFQDTDSERLYLYEKLIQHGWKRNYTNLRHLREELKESGINAADDLVLTRENAPLNASLPFYISTKVPVNDSFERVRSYNVTSRFRENIPVESPFGGKKYGRCAVIGNSGSILNSCCGREIDGFDFIFRCNAAPIDKYANDAGWRSNITTFNPSIFYRRFNALQEKGDYLRFKQNITQYNGYLWLACFGSAALHNVCLTPILTGDSRGPREPQLVLSNPDQFSKFWQFWKTRNISKTPSTGFFMTHAALELCEETHLYGFWPFPLRLDSSFERVPYHYFDDLVVSKRHGMSDEFSVFLQYHELGILQLHTGKCRNEKT